jgi:hypothetical protein
MKYNAVLPVDKPKYFELTITANDKDGNASKKSTKTFELVNADPTLSPKLGDTTLTANSVSQNFYLEIHMPTEYGTYIQDALLVHLDAFNKYGTGFGRGTKNTADKYKWKNLAPDDNYNNIGAVDFTLVGSVGNFPILEKKSIFFNGSQWGVSNNTLNLAGLEDVTVEIVFKEADTAETVFLFEYSRSWNNNVGGFGAAINHGSGAYASGSVHTNLSQGHPAANYAWNNDNTVITTHTNIFSSVAKADGRQVYVDAAKSQLYKSGDLSSGWYLEQTPITDITNSTFSFGNQLFFIGTRDSGSIPALNFKGDIYCVRIYGRKLNVDEIKHNYNTDLLRYQDRAFG